MSEEGEGCRAVQGDEHTAITPSSSSLRSAVQVSSHLTLASSKCWQPTCVENTACAEKE